MVITSVISGRRQRDGTTPLVYGYQAVDSRGQKGYKARQLASWPLPVKTLLSSLCHQLLVYMLLPTFWTLVFDNFPLVS